MPKEAIPCAESCRCSPCCRLRSRLPPFPKSVEQEELRRLRGQWVMVSITHGGKKIADRKLTIVFFQDHVELIDADGTYKWGLIRHPSISPKGFDLWLVIDGRKRYIRYVYRIDGDTLTTCYKMHVASTTRPSDLSGKGDSLCQQVFRRKKP